MNWRKKPTEAKELRWRYILRDDGIVNSKEEEPKRKTLVRDKTGTG